MKRNNIILTLLEAKKISIILFTVILMNQSFAVNNNRENTVQTRLFPTYNSDFSYFFMRRDMKMFEQMTSAETIIHEDGSADIRTKLFIPFYKSEKWSYSIPIYFDRYQFLGENENEKLNVNNLFGQSLLTYHPNEKFDFSHIIEFRFKGADNHFIDQEGNFMAQFLTAQYNWNEKFSLLAGSLIGVGWDHNSESYIGVKPAFMLKWQPNQYLNIMIGVPASAIEWSAPFGFDIMAHSLLDGSEFNVSAAIRKNLGAKFDITFRYLHEGYDQLYTPIEAINFELPDQDLSFDQINQYQDKLQLQLTFRPEANTIIQLIGGIAENRDLNLFNEEEIQTTISSSNGYYFGINLARTIQLIK